MGGTESTNKFIYSIEVPNSAKPGSSSVFVNPQSRAYLMSQNPYGNTLYEIFESAVRRFPNQPYLGTRAKTEAGFGDYQWLTYEQVQTRARSIGWGLSALGLAEKDEDGNSFLGIYSKNRMEWILMDHACIRQDIITVPVYDTLQSDALEYMVEQTKMRVVACDYKSSSNVLKLRKEGELRPLQIIIQFEEVSADLAQEAEQVGLKIYSLSDIEKLGTNNQEKSNIREDRPPKPDSIFTICYTSGTTGRAKGAMLTHVNFVSTFTGLIENSFAFQSTDVHLSYLPLAHVMERLAIHHFTSFGMSVGFFQGEILKLKEDLASLKPTVFISVPRLYNRFNDLISQQLSELTGPKKLLASRGLSAKQHYYRTQGALTHKLWDSLIFQKIKNVLGGRVKIMVTGSAPISGDVIDFLKVVFSCPFIEGYGQTESSGGTCLTNRLEKTTGIIGGPVTTAELKLADVPDMEYLSTDVDQNGFPTPRGEICIRGPVVFAGYYKNPEITSETIDQEGWLHTGDVGLRNFHDGSFKIIDRKKNFFKLQQGEYVSAEKIEMVYAKSYFISQIFVYGDSLQSYLVAIVIPDDAFIRKRWAKENGFDENTEWQQICSSEKLTKAVLQEMDEKAKEFKLLGFEVVKKVFLEPKPWTTDDLLTPTQKLMRFNAKKKYDEVIQRLYLQ